MLICRGTQWHETGYRKYVSGWFLLCTENWNKTGPFWYPLLLLQLLWPTQCLSQTTVVKTRGSVFQQKKLISVQRARPSSILLPGMWIVHEWFFNILNRYCFKQLISANAVWYTFVSQLEHQWRDYKEIQHLLVPDKSFWTFPNKCWSKQMFWSELFQSNVLIKQMMFWSTTKFNKSLIETSYQWIQWFSNLSSSLISLLVCCHCFIAFHQWQILLWLTFTFRVLSRLALYFHKMICSLSATVQASSIVWGKHHLETVQTVGLETVHCCNLDTVQCSLLSRDIIIWSKWEAWNFTECFLDIQVWFLKIQFCYNNVE